MGQLRKDAVASRTCAGPQLDAGTSSNRDALDRIIVIVRFERDLRVAFSTPIGASKSPFKMFKLGKEDHNPVTG